MVSRSVPTAMELAMGEVRFEGPLGSDEGPVYRLGLGVAWTSEADEDVEFSIVIVETAEAVDAQVAVFRRTLWAYLGAAAGLLLAVQILISRWSLQPLRAVVGELAEVERGEVERLGGDYPRELADLTEHIYQQDFDRDSNVLVRSTP